MEGGGGAPTMTMQLRWVSALPMKTAQVWLKMGAEAKTSEQAKKFLEQDEKYYVLSLSAPAMGGPRPGGEGGQRPAMSPEMLEAAKAATTLSWKGHEGLHPVDVHQAGGGTMMYSFSKEHAIELDDKEVEFTTKRGPMEIKKKFRLKDMVYHGKLAL